MFTTFWNYKHKTTRSLSQEPCELKDDMPFKSITERCLEARAMGEAYNDSLRRRFMLPSEKTDPLDLVQDMDSITTPFDELEDLGDAQKAYQQYMRAKAQQQAYMRQVAKQKEKLAESSAQDEKSDSLQSG